MTTPAQAKILEAIEALAAARHHREIAGGHVMVAAARFEHLDSQVEAQRKALEALIEAELSARPAPPACALVIPISQGRRAEHLCGERRSQEPPDAA